MSDFIDDFHKTVHDWADHLELDGDERDDYIAFHMEKRGYQRATTWTPPEPDPDKGGSGSMFSKKKSTAPGARRPASKPGAPAGEQYFRK